MIIHKRSYLLLATVFFIVGLYSPTGHTLPEISTWQTDNGVKVLYVNTPELPIVDIALTFDAGSARDGALPGLSSVMHGLMDKGTGQMNADEVASRFEDVGAQFGVSVDLDRSSATLRSLSNEELFNQALDMYIAVVSKPSFPSRDFERDKKRLLVSLQEGQQRPGEIVSRTFFDLLYGEHPYGQPSNGTEESVGRISLQDVKQFHAQYIVAANSVLAIVGDLSRQQAESIALKISQSLPVGKLPAPPVAVKKSSLAKKHVDFPSQQAHVRMGQTGIQRGHPDYFNLYVGNHVLGGGGFTSRLVEEVRSKRGLSYSVYSYFLPYRQQGPFMLGLQTRSDQVTEAIQVCRQVLAGYIEKGPTEDELALSKQSIINSFPLRIDSNKDLLGYLSMIGYYDLPLNYLSDFSENIKRVSLQDVKKAFREHLDLDSFVTVVVGREQTSQEDA